MRTTGQVSATGNVTGNYFIGNGSQLTGIAASYGNAEVAAYLPTYTGNLVSLTGPVTTIANISGNYIIGNGALLTGLPATYGNANVATFLDNFGSNAIVTTGNITGGNLRTAGQVSATGDVTGANINVAGNVLISRDASVGQPTIRFTDTDTTVTDGQVLRLRGKGGVGPRGGEPGDALVEIKVRVRHLVAGPHFSTMG